MRPDAVRYDPEQLSAAGDVELCSDAFGDPADPSVLLVMGMGFQLVHWPEEFCRRLAAEGLRVVRFDNRDAGRSTHLPGRRYRLEDMAGDAVRLLDAHGIAAAHVVGASLGGMVAQTMAVEHPGRVRSLASLMSTTGARGVGRTSLRVYRHALGRRPRTTEEAVERRVRAFATVGSTGFPQDVDELRRTTALAFQRDPDSRAGARRQLRAVRTAGDRTASLRRIQVPTVVVHGTADRMCAPSGGRATAAAVPGARLVLVPGLGHDLPRGAWPVLLDAVVANARRAG
ncbi:alpha/beta fold hydrolase [Modestobacter sp. URMC 112]